MSELVKLIVDYQSDGVRLSIGDKGYSLMSHETFNSLVAHLTVSALLQESVDCFCDPEDVSE